MVNSSIPVWTSSGVSDLKVDAGGRGSLGDSAARGGCGIIAVFAWFFFSMMVRGTPVACGLGAWRGGGSLMSKGNL